MSESRYISMVNKLGSNPTLAKAVSISNKVLTYAIYLAYPCLLVWLGYSALTQWNTETGITAITTLAVAFFVPLISFVLLTFLRKAVNAPRPYEVLDIKPAITKDTKGLSFPSRHVFSIFVIGTTFCAVCPIPWIGWIVLVMGVVLAAMRVLGGVHFPCDVIAGALLGIICGSLCFYLI